MSKFSASVRNLFAGSSLSTPPEDDDTHKPQGNTGPTEAAVEALVEKAAAEASTAATAAANTRWNTVMTSAEGIAQPKAAARLLSTTTMSADDVVATLADLKPADPAAGTSAQREERQQANEAARQALAGDPDARPDTGAAGGSPQQRRGEGDDRSAIKERRAKRNQRTNARLEKQGGVHANTVTAN